MREQLVFRVTPFNIPTAVAPIPAALENPGTQGRRRIVHSISQRLRIAGLNRYMTDYVRCRLFGTRDSRLLIGAVVSIAKPTGGEEIHWNRQRQIDSDQML